MHAASQLPGRGSTDVDDAPAPAKTSDYDDDMGAGIEVLILTLLSHIGRHMLTVYLLYRKSCTWLSNDIISMLKWRQVVLGLLKHFRKRWELISK